MILIIIGIILIAVGGGLYYMRGKSLDKAMDIKYYETSTIADVVRTYNEIKDTVGVGSYNGTIVELKGTGHSDQPLLGEHSRRPCLYYESSVTREYETTEQERDSQGNYRTVTKRHTETVSSNKQGIPFHLNDGSGSTILIDIEGAKKDLVQSFDQFERELPAGFSFSFSVANSKTIGYRYKEKMIPNDAKLYVLGEISDRRGELSIVKPQDKNKNFIISTKSEEEIVKSTESAAQWQMIGAIASAVIGVGTIIAGIIQLF
jgi:hypothetical protein